MSLVNIIQRQQEEAVLENNAVFKSVTSHKSLHKYSIWFEKGGKEAYQRGHGPRYKVQMTGSHNKVPMHGITLAPIDMDDVKKGFDLSRYNKELKPFLSRGAIHEAIANLCYKPDAANIDAMSLSQAVMDISKTWSPDMVDDYDTDVNIIASYVTTNNGKTYKPFTIKEIKRQMEDGVLFK